MHAGLVPLKAPVAAPARIPVDTLIDGVDRLLSLPDAAMRLNELLLDPEAPTGEIAAVVSLDPALSARLLRFVNSAYFGLPGRVDTISRAISMVGTSELHSLVLATSAALAFRNISSKLVDMEAFWQHSVRAALAARHFANANLRRHRERIFLTAMLHDVGELVIYHQLPAEATRVLQAVALGEPRDVAEHAVLGYTHADVGAALLARWNLPPALTEPVRFHHDFTAAGEHAQVAALVHLGSRVSHLMDHDLPPPGQRHLDAPPEAWALGGCGPEMLDDVIVDVSMNWLQIIEIVAPGSVRI